MSFGFFAPRSSFIEQRSHLYLNLRARKCGSEATRRVGGGARRARRRTEAAGSRHLMMDGRARALEPLSARCQKCGSRRAEVFDMFTIIG